MKSVSRNKDEGNFLLRYWKSFCHALDGILYAIRYEHNLMIIIVAILVTIIAGFYFQISTSEWLFCISIIGAVAATEMINTAIEAVVDMVTLKYHPLAKIAKDTASSATLILCVVAFIGACLIFVPKIFN